MTDEKILKLIGSSIEEDVILGLHYAYQFRDYDWFFDTVLNVKGQTFTERFVNLRFTELTIVVWDEYSFLLDTDRIWCRSSIRSLNDSLSGIKTIILTK